MKTLLVILGFLTVAIVLYCAHIDRKGRER